MNLVSLEFYARYIDASVCADYFYDLVDLAGRGLTMCFFSLKSFL